MQAVAADQDRGHRLRFSAHVKAAEKRSRWPRYWSAATACMSVP